MPNDEQENRIIDEKVKESMKHILAYVYPLTNYSMEIRVFNRVTGEQVKNGPDPDIMRESLMAMLQLISGMFDFTQEEIHRMSVGGKIEDAIAEVRTVKNKLQN